MATPPPRLPPIQSFDFQPYLPVSEMPPSPNASRPVPPSDASMDAIVAQAIDQSSLPPPASIVREDMPAGVADALIHHPDPGGQPVNEADNADELSEDDDGDDDDDGDVDGDHADSYPWQPIEEDKSEPCVDELSFIESKEEHSALDHSYWEQESFFDLDDPDLTPGDSGRIDWLVEHFNGTKETPNKTLVMQSPVVRIGGYDWQIRFYPRGNRTEFLSVYVECVSMQKEDFIDRIDMSKPPLPTPVGSPMLKRRVSLAAQVSVVMYNPADPRVYEYKADAHQFHKGMPDFGWKYFTREPRYDFHTRKHGQRQAILRNDQLAFSAYIRIIHDPTGCMWDSNSPSFDTILSATGLYPFDCESAQIAALVPLFHLRCFRDFIYENRAEGLMMTQLHLCLDRFLSRRLKRKHLRGGPLHKGRDVVEVLRILRSSLAKDSPPNIVAEFDAIFTSLAPGELPICDTRLKSSGFASVQQAASSQLPPTIHNSPFLTIELERQRFDDASRKWVKVENRVHLDNELIYGKTQYSLFAFVTYSGELGSGFYTSYVRPGGPGGMWYAYEANNVKCLTHKAAVSAHCGGNATRSKEKKEEPSPFASRTPSRIAREPGVAYLVMYVRSDMADYNFAMPAQEMWKVPNPPKTSHRAVDRIGALAGYNRPTPPWEKDSIATHVAQANDAHPHAAPFDAQSTPPVLDDSSQDTMDGADVIMSDAEDDEPSHVHLDSTLGGSASSRPSTFHEDGEQQDQLQASRHTIINYFTGQRYEGHVVNDDTFHGQGHLIDTNGDEYIGAFHLGQPSGQGTMTYGASGNKYEGQWLAGKHHGQGKLFEQQTGNVFEGGWKEGRRHGSFVLRGTVTEDDKQCCQICYEREMNTAFYDCGHVLACRQCSTLIEVCPVCRKRVLARLELFGVKVSMD